MTPLRTLAALLAVGLAAAAAWVAVGRGDAALEPTSLRGSFDGLTHPTDGTATVTTRADGKRVLRLARFRTQPAPDLYVYLVAGARPGGDVTGGARIARLRRSLGDQSYVLADDVELGQRATVVVWCEKCSAAFGMALLRPAPGGRSRRGDAS